MTSITPFLWFDNNVPEAVAFYKSVFPNAKVEVVNDFMATFELEGQRFNALNGGPKYKFNEAVSFFVSVESQEEVDYFWNRLIADGGEESQCGWLKDKFGLSWQVVPTALGRYLSDPDRKKADRAMQAMMKMQRSSSPTSKRHMPAFFLESSRGCRPAPRNPVDALLLTPSRAGAKLRDLDRVQRRPSEAGPRRRTSRSNGLTRRRDPAIRPTRPSWPEASIGIGK